MVAAKEYQTNQQISARNSSSYLDQMALLQHQQNGSLPSLPPSTFNSTVAFPRYYSSDFCGVNEGQIETIGGVLKPVHLSCNNSNPTDSVYSNNAQCALSRECDVADKTINPSCAPQKMFLIFDRSGSRTTLFFSPSFSPQNQSMVCKTHANANGLCDNMVAQIDQQHLIKPALEEHWDENDMTEGEGEMREDTAEINALLYSDSDDDDDDDGKNDEVTSTAHSPFIIGEGYNKDKLTEVVNSDDSPKRQRLLDGTYKKSSIANAKSPVSQPVSQCYEDDVESSCAGDAIPNDETNMRTREKVKIRQALTTLASIIPSPNIKDPLSIIDEAISYLKSMKSEAEAEDLQLSYTGCKSTTSPPNRSSSQAESLHTGGNQETTKYVFQTNY